MKKAEYAAGVTAIYRKYIDKFYQSPDKNYSVEKKDLEQLSKLYIRSEIHDGYYFKQNGAEMVTLTNPAYSGSDDVLLSEIHDKYIKPADKLPISVYSCFITGQKVSLTLVHGEYSVTVEGDIAEKAQNAPLTSESIQKQLLKMGDTSFEVLDAEIYTDNECFYPVKLMNDLRRKAVRLLEDEIISSFGLPTSRECNMSNVNDASTSLNTQDSFSSVYGWTVTISTQEQLLAVQEFYASNPAIFRRIYLESELILANNNNLLDIFDTNVVYIALPYCMRQKDISKLNFLLDYAKLKSIKGFLIRNIEEYAFLTQHKYIGEIYADAGIYTWNRYSRDFWLSKTNGITCSLELNKNEWKSLFQYNPYEKIVY